MSSPDSQSHGAELGKEENKVNVMKLLVAAMISGLVSMPLSSFAQQPANTYEQQLAELNWLRPGSTGHIEDKAKFLANENYTFLNAPDTEKYLALNGNPSMGEAYTIASRHGTWWGILQFLPEGYVKDEEKIDAAALLKTMKENSAQDNVERSRLGYPTLTLEGWQFPPRYDAVTNRLEWGTRYRSGNGQLVVNVTTKILGRSGHTSAILVTSPETVDSDLPDFKVAIKNFEYVSGEKYSEWKEGDKVAAYGLGALVLGGAAAAATSKGGFKVIVAAVLAGLAAVWAGIKKLFSRKKD